MITCALVAGVLYAAGPSMSNHVPVTVVNKIENSRNVAVFGPDSIFDVRHRYARDEAEFVAMNAVEWHQWCYDSAYEKTR